jgi:hypothetical protein
VRVFNRYTASYGQTPITDSFLTMRNLSALLCLFSNHLRVIALLLFLGFSPSTSASAQSEGDFRSRSGGGQWSKSNTWDEYTPTGWLNTNKVPNSADGKITILTGHVVNANSIGTYDQVVIEAGAELNISKAFTVGNGPGLDLEVRGLLSINNTLSFATGATSTFKSGSELMIGRSSTFTTLGTSAITFESGSIASSQGVLDLQNSSVVNFNSGAVYTNGGTISMLDSSQLLVNGGTLINQKDITAVGTSLVGFSNGATYIHDQNGGALPPVDRTTWGTDSEAKVIGVTNSLPTQLNDTIYNFTWENAGQSADLSLDAAPLGFLGDFTVVSTGTGSLSWNSIGAPMTIGGDFVQTGSDFRFQDTGSAVITIAGGFSQSAGTTYLATTSGSPVLNIGGDITVASALINSSTSFATLSLNGNVAQAIDVSGSLTGNIDLVLSGSGLKSLASDLTLTGSLTETSGGLDLAGKNLTLTGNLLVSTQFSNPAQMAFTGAGDKQIDLPVSSSLKEYQRVKQPVVNVLVEAAQDNSVLFQVVPMRKQLRMIKTSSLSIREAVVEKPDAVENRPIPKNENKALLPIQDEAPFGDDNSIQSSTKPASTGNWLDMLRDSALETSKKKKQGAAFIPFYVRVTPTEPGPSFDSPVYLFMLILTVLFYLSAIELIIRNLISRNQPSIKNIERPVWIWAYRQISAYICLLSGITYYLGPLGGFAIALGLAGISVSIEFKEQYKNIGAILVLLLRSNVRVGAWIAYREGVAQVTDLNLQFVTLTMHGGLQVSLSPFALLHVSVSKWKPDQVRNETIEIGVSRFSNLRSIRQIVSDTLLAFAPTGTLHHAHINFQDLDAQRTVVLVETVVDGNTTNKAAIKLALENAFREIGVDLCSLDIQAKAERSAHAPSSSNANYPPLRLIKNDSDKAA